MGRESAGNISFITSYKPLRTRPSSLTTPRAPSSVRQRSERSSPRRRVVVSLTQLQLLLWFLGRRQVKPPNILVRLKVRPRPVDILHNEQLLKALGIITDFKSMSGLAINLDKSEVL